uniref:glucan endo-1,3-beta-D-glucosidase n=1 Tax=Cannabis sativa TaxID=3483 RepID=A0A803P1U8_CANSA
MAAPLLISFLLLYFTAAGESIGVNYGTLANNLPSPAQVANFLKTQTVIDRVKIFDVNPDILRAFAGSGIAVTVTVGNGEIVGLKDPRVARRWVSANIKPFHPATKINYIAVGNEVLHWGDKFQVSGLVPAMKSLHHALIQEGIKDIKVTSPHSLGILSVSEPPSSARFRRGYDRAVFVPMLKFLQETNSPLMVNPYPYFGYNPKMPNYSLFKPNRGIRDPKTGITYTNMFDAQMDAVHTAAKAIGFGNVELVIGETGWSSACEWEVCSIEHARDYNANLIKHINSGKGTPLMPNRKFETYLFALFNENLKPGPLGERNWGLFQPDFTPVYDVGILRNGQRPGGSGGGGGSSGAVGKKWCVPKLEASGQALQANIDYVCSSGVDCKPIQPGGSCFQPNDVRSHASFVMNSFYQTNGRHDYNCDFAKTGLITSSNPSRGSCVYV